MDTVLVVDDDKMMRHVIRLNLENEDIMVIEATMLKRLFDILSVHKVDLILLDLGLPDGNAMDFIKEIRAYSDVPLIIVSGHHECSKKTQGLNLGADDYIHKPFDVSELIARVKSHIRRYKGFDVSKNQSNNSNLMDNEGIGFCGLMMRKSQYQVFKEQGISCDLTPQEFLLLQILINDAGRPVHRDALCEAIRSESNYAPSGRAIDIKVMRLRKKLENSEWQGSDIITTVRGVGYMFNAECLKEAG